jgi:dTDP-4-dehydrorhamnose reductase
MIDVLITGGSGMLAYALQQEFARRGYTVQAPTRSQLDVTKEDQVHNLIRRMEPRVIIQCAAYTRVDDAESHEDDAYRVNALGTKFVAEAAHHVGARFVFPSTDYVFDGSATSPYRPADEPSPINAYGRTKVAGEEFARLAPHHLIIRMSWLYGPGGRNFVRTIAERLERSEVIRVVNDQVGRPTWTIDAARAIIELAVKTSGAAVYHWANSSAATWFDLAQAVERVKARASLVYSCTTRDFPAIAKRPAFSVLDSSISEALIGPAREWRLAIEDALVTGSY